jgi:hypothetical protein
MGTFDGKVIFDLEPSTHMKAVALGTILDPDNEDPFECLLAQYAERYACNADYTIDLPVYIVTQGKSYVGHISGEHTQQALRTQLQEFVRNATNSESEGSAV